MATKKVPQATPKTKKQDLSAADIKAGTDTPKATEPTSETAAAEGPTEATTVPAPTTVVSELQVASIRLDGGTQSRASLNTQTIGEYGDAMTAGATFPPVVVFFDGKTRWLADGFRRVNASLKLGRDRIACDIRPGTQRDAILYSVTANASHGLRRTSADKRHAVDLLLRDAKLSRQKSDRAIGELCGVDHKTVAKRRAEISTGEIPQLATPRLGKDGKARNLPKAGPASVKRKPASPTAAPAVAAPLSIAMAPLDEASALADLQSDIERHLLAWTWSIDPVLAVLASTAEKVRNQFATRKAI